MIPEPHSVVLASTLCGAPMLRRNMTMRRAGVTTGADAPFPVVNPWPKAMIAGEGDKLAAFPLFLDDFPVFLAHST
jgi:hypothetical protein